MSMDMFRGFVFAAQLCALVLSIWCLVIARGDFHRAQDLLDQVKQFTPRDVGRCT